MLGSGAPSPRNVRRRAQWPRSGICGKGTAGRHLLRRALAPRAVAWAAAILAGARCYPADGLLSSCLHGASTAASWRRDFFSQWDRLPRRADRLKDARRLGLFDVTHRGGATMTEDEEMWTREYSPEGNYEFWSLGRPKLELAQLVRDMACPEEGISAVVLGCGLGVEVEHLATAAQAKPGAPGLHAVAGVDIAASAVDKARDAFGSLPGVFFYHADVCELPPPAMPLDLVVDNTVFQNMDAHQMTGYLEALRRISTPGHTLLHLNLMSEEGIRRRPEFNPCFDYLNLPLVEKKFIVDTLGADWSLLEAREGLYDLRPEGAGFECEAFYKYGGKETPGIPSWCLLLLRRAA